RPADRAGRARAADGPALEPRARRDDARTGGVTMIRGCRHERCSAQVDIQRLTDNDGRGRHFVAEATVRCSDCGEPFHFLGCDVGLSFARPMVNVGATTLHAPIAPGEGPFPDRVRYELPSRGRVTTARRWPDAEGDHAGWIVLGMATTLTWIAVATTCGLGLV